MQDVARQGIYFIKTVGIILSAGIFAMAAPLTDLFLREADLWWHIKSGQVMLATGHVPQVDTFSYTHEGQPWIAKEWLSQVIYAVVYDSAGWGGPLLLSAMVIALTAWLLYTSFTRNLQPIFAVLLVLFCQFMVVAVTAARPHVFTFPIAVAFTILLFGAARRMERPPFWALLLIVLWTNLHSSFAISFLIAGAAFLDYAQRSRIGDKRTLALWVLFLVLCPAVTLVNPYFIRPHIIALNLVNGIAIMDKISDWAPFTAPNNKAVEFGFMAVLFSITWSRARLTIGQIIFALFMLHMMLSYLRFIYLFFLLVPLVVLPEVVEAWPVLSMERWQQRARDSVECFVGRNSVIISGLVLLMSLSFAGFLLESGRAKPPEFVAISGALAFVERNVETHPSLKMRVLNGASFGGALIMKNIKTYIDGRMEQLFFGDFMTNYLDSGSASGMPQLQKILEDKSIGWTIFPPDSQRNTNLAKLPEWEKTYSDDYAVIYERKGRT